MVLGELSLRQEERREGKKGTSTHLWEEKGPRIAVDHVNCRGRS